MKKSIIICVLVFGLSLLLAACAPGSLNPDDTRPKVVIFDAPNGSQINGLKKVFYSVLNANDAIQPFNVLPTNLSDYYETNGSIIGAQSEYYGALATRRIGSDLGIFVHAPILERVVLTETKEVDKDGFLDVASGNRVVVTKLQLEAFILDPITEKRIVTYNSNIYESVRREKAAKRLVLKEQDPDIWNMANIALREFALQAVNDLTGLTN